VLRKLIVEEQGQQVLACNYRYFFYVTNDRSLSLEQVVAESNDRCNQENLIEHLKNGARAFHAPVNTLNANWTYMVMASLAWSLKAWCALMLPISPHWRQQHEMERDRVLHADFNSFIQGLILVPAQIIKTGRLLVFRLLSWRPDLPLLFRLLDAVSRISFVSALLFCCGGDDVYGVRRTAQLDALPDVECIERTLRANPQIESVKRREIQARAGILTTADCQLTSSGHEFSYSVAGIPAYFRVHARCGKTIFAINDSQNMGFAPPQADIDRIRPVMVEVEAALAERCDMVSLATRVTEECYGVRCVPLPANESQER
jgi:hypothetical protein